MPFIKYMYLSKKNQYLSSKSLSFLVFFFLSSFSQTVFAQIKFEVKGIDDQLKENVDAYLENIPQSDLEQEFRLKSTVNKEITTALQALGYFHPKISFNGQRTSFLGDKIIQIDVQPGEPVIIGDVNIKIAGEADKDSAFLDLLETGPKVGEILDQGKYETLKSNIRRLSVVRGYFDGDFGKTKIEVAPSINEAFISLDYNSGNRYSYGDISYVNSQIDIDRLNTLRNFETGQPYLVTELSDFNQALANMGWFSSALVEADLANAIGNQVPIKVSLEPAPRNVFETGLGYSTNSGPRFKLGWKKPWFNRRGHSLNTNLFLSKPKQTLETSYKIPLLNAATEYYQVQFGLERLDQNDTESLELTSSVSRHWLYKTGWQRIIYLRWLYSNFTQAQISDTSNLILPGINFSRVRTQGSVMPYWGDKYAITFETAGRIWGSDLDVLRIYGESSWIRSIKNENIHRFIYRINSGMDLTDDIEKLPPSLRFFAGGDNSLRGYGYETVSPRDEQGRLVGGKYLLTASAEYNYRFIENWWLAAFVDGGDAWTNLNPRWKTSVGIGIRWKSPVGPVRLDIAHGFENPEDNFMFHFSLGPEL